MNNTVKAISMGLFILSILLLDCSPLFSQPDLTIDRARLLQDLRTDLLDNNDPCYINEGCVGGMGDRQIIRFSTHIKNIGTEDFIVGTPPGHPSLENEIWEYDQCHKHWHYEGYAQYLLFDQVGNELPVGLKNGFCLMDSECSGGGTLQYHCGYQGISAGCGDIYGWSLDCQWIDVTDVASGVYRLVNRVNWTRSPDAFNQEESNYDNNEASVCIRLSRSANGAHLFEVLPDAQCNCTDNDNDGICMSNDCDDNDPNFPKTIGQSCDDGEITTINDVIQADGCTCQGTSTIPCTDADNDGVCAEEDCDDTNPNLPALIGQSCDDGDATTSNDVILADACTCQGTGNTTTLSCNEITLTYGDGQIKMEGIVGNTYYYKIHDLNNNWKEEFSCSFNCAITQTATLPPSLYKVKVYNTDWTPICDTDITLTGTAAPCIDGDNDGVCADIDCNDNNPNLPATPGTSCSDGNANTTGDVILADGCTCQGTSPNCIDNDNDGVCADVDCDDNNANLPAAPGATCNDGNASTTGDVILADGCTCQGTLGNNTGMTTLSCDEITLSYGNGQINMVGLPSNIYYFKIHDLNSNWQEVFSCSFNCGTSQTATLAPSFYKVKVYNASWIPICDTDILLTGTATACTDADGDTICAADDCDDNNPAIPAPPGTSCNDGNAATTGDVILADGCTCQGTTPNCTDVDGDGVCAIADCDDNNANVPTAPGTSCNDGNATTNNDVILADGCTCQGTISTCTDIDGDGVCSIADCDDTNANVPTAPGTSCNDGNANTNNDVILADGCTCQGSTTATTTGTCADIAVSTAANTIIINGLTAPIEIIKIYSINGGWRQVFDCIADCGDQQTVDNLPVGRYVIEFQFYAANWATICSVQETVTVTSTLTQENETVFSRLGKTTSTLSDIKLAPNPAKETLQITLEEWREQTLELTIYNHLSQIILQQPIQHIIGKTHQLDLPTLASGIHFVQISDGEKILTKKLLIR